MYSFHVSYILTNVYLVSITNYFFSGIISKLTNLYLSMYVLTFIRLSNITYKKTGFLYVFFSYFKCSLLGLNISDFRIIPLYENVTLTCPISSAHVSFLKNCAKMKDGSKFISGKSLTIRRFTWRNNALYTCQGTDQTGKLVEYSWLLHVKLSK